MYPLKIKRKFIKKIWGGYSFESFFEKQLPTKELYGESWEISSHKNAMSIVKNGVFKDLSLQFLLEKYREKLVGENVYKKYVNKFPLLVKYLDINDKLSVQVHPGDEYALKIEGEFGKSESWYIIEASEDASLIVGTKNGITKENFLKKMETGEYNDVFNIIRIKKGDFINITPGTIHATLTGSVLICEIQQNSDTTYRIYDFNRIVDGELRELHIEKAMEVINFNKKPDISNSLNRKKIELENCLKEELASGEHFSIDKLDIDGIFSDGINTSFKIYSVISGNGYISFNDTLYELKRGDTYFIPALLEVSIEGKLEIIKSYL